MKYCGAKQKWMAALLCICLVLAPGPGTSARQAPPLGGSGGPIAFLGRNGQLVTLPGRGTQGDPLMIYSGEELRELAWSFNSGGLPAELPAGEDLHVRLGRDLALSGIAWEPLGTEDTPFAGTLDGNGKTVSGLSVRGSWAYGGLFGVLAGQVKDLTLDGASIAAGASAAGGIAGSVSGGRIANCRVEGTVRGTGEAGGLAGRAEDGFLSGCVFTGQVSGREAGGIAGLLSGGGIARSAAQGRVDGSASSGGIAGTVKGEALLEEVLAEAAVSGGLTAGGLAGSMEGGASLRDSYSLGAIQAAGTGSSAGGLAGLTGAGSVTIEFCYFAGPAVSAAGSGGARAGGLIGWDRGAASVAGCLALAGAVEAGGQAGAVCGEAASASAYRDNTSWSGTRGTTVDSLAQGRDGDWLSVPQNWSGLLDRDAWESGEALPVLDGPDAAQQGALPEHLLGAVGEVGLIYTAAELAAITETGSYRLMADIHLAGGSWTPIRAFAGHLDGNGKTIHGLTSSANGAQAGLIGELTGTVTGLHMTGVSLSHTGTSGNRVGAVAAVCRGGEILNCTVEGTITGAETGYAGGIAGVVAAEGRIADCYAQVQISGGNAGGIAGQLAGSIRSCGSRGTVTGAANAGGIAGELAGDAVIAECYTDAAVKAASGDADVTAGGIVGSAEFYSAAISDCYALGAVSATGSTGLASGGGIAGRVDSNMGEAISIVRCYSAGGVDAQSSNGSSAGGIIGEVADIFQPIGFQGNCALNPSVRGDNSGALIGTSSGAEAKDSYYLSALPAESSAGDHRAITAADAGKRETWNFLADSGCWTTADHALPILSDAPGYQAGEFPAHILAEIPGKRRIGSASQLAALAEGVNRGDSQLAEGAYVLASDIDLSRFDWTPIGTAAYPFRGSFDGNGYRIRGLTVTGWDYGGLFGLLDGASVEGILLPDCSVDAGISAGAVAAVAEGGAVVADCAATGRIAAGAGSAGGIIGENATGVITVARCSFDGTIISRDSGSRAGGIAGSLRGSLYDCRSSAGVTGGEAGGIVGRGAEGSSVFRVYTTGSVTGVAAAGGVSGSNGSILLSAIALCSGVQGPENRTGRLVGTGDAAGSYGWAGTKVNGASVTQDGGIHGTGIATGEALGEAFYRELDFGEAWLVPQGGLPVLAGGLGEGVVPFHMRGYPSASTMVVLAAAGGSTSFAQREEELRVALTATVTTSSTPGGLDWSLDTVAGPRLEGGGNNTRELVIPPGWTGAVTVFAALETWSDIAGRLTVRVNGDLALAGGWVELDAALPRYGDTIRAVFTPPADGETGRTSYQWLVGDRAVGGDEPVLEIAEASWIGKPLKVRVACEHYATSVESDASGVERALYGGHVPNPVVVAVKQTGFTLQSVDGFEYGCWPAGDDKPDGLADIWQESATFTGLLPATSYRIYQRAARTDTVEASAISSPLTATTLKADSTNPGEDVDPPTEPPTAPPTSPPTGSGVKPDLIPNASSSGLAGGSGTQVARASAAVRGEISAFLADRIGEIAGNRARKAGKNSATARILNPGRISAAALRAMAAAAGLPLRLYADSMSGTGKQVNVRIILDPALAVRDLDLSARTEGSRVEWTENHFGKWFANRVEVVSLGQQGDYGMAVEVAAMVDLEGMEPESIVCYSYLRSTNSYRRIDGEEIRIDANGYLRFSTRRGGEIIVSDGPLRGIGAE